MWEYHDECVLQIIIYYDDFFRIANSYLYQYYYQCISRFIFNYYYYYFSYFNYDDGQNELNQIMEM